MVLAATLVMIISMTFRLPYGAYAALYALNVSRDSLEGTKRAVHWIVVGFGFAGAYLLTGTMLVLGDPVLRFLWIAATLFLIFWGISATGSFAAWTRFGYMAVITITLWDRHITAQAKVYGLLWAIWMLTLASMIALLVEIGYAALKPGNDLTDAVAERLANVEQLLRVYADGRTVDAKTHARITRLAMLGTSRLRGLLTRSNKSPQYVQEMGAVVALTGRLVDLAANLPNLAGDVPIADRDRIGRIANQIAEIRHDLENGLVPPVVNRGDAVESWPCLPLLGEIETTTSLIPEVFSGSQSWRIFDAAAPDAGARSSAMVRGAWFNPEHLKFGLKGCLAASLCYIIYSALFWPEISTSVTTCFLTALTTIGASHQKQVLRIAGAVLGGFVIGMGAQVFILPSIDSIAGFTALFIVVSVFAAWIITSSPRLSYLGVQVAFAFYLINLQEFRIQTSLAVARDRVVGILIGLLVMWLVFDQLWSVPAAVAVRKEFASSLRLLAQLAREPSSNDLRIAIEAGYSLRERINAQFDKVRSLADGVLFEFGPSRQKDLELRSQIRKWQPQLQALFLMRIASWKYRAQTPGFEFPRSVCVRQAAYDARSAQMLEQMADRVENDGPGIALGFDDSAELLKRTIEEAQAEELRGLPVGRAQSFITLFRDIDALTTSLAAGITADLGVPGQELH
jgi:multidrug resistance protein MdtO